jgi:hypothetical protein
MSAQPKTKPINRSDTNQLTDLFELDSSKLIFDEPIKNEMPGIPPYYRINLAIKNPDGKTESDLFFQLDRCKTFGIKENRDNNTGNLTGYAVGILLFDKSGATERQQQLFQAMNEIVEKCKDHLMSPETKKKVGKTQLKVREQLDSITPISYIKNKETLEFDMNAPILNAKLMYAKTKTDKEGNEIPSRIMTRFYDEDELESTGVLETSVLDPLENLNRRGWITPVIRFESIFVGKDIKIQAKIYQAVFKVDEETGFKNLLRFGGLKTTETVINVSMNDAPIEETPKIEALSISNDALVASDDESTAPKKKIIKKKISLSSE